MFRTSFFVFEEVLCSQPHCQLLAEALAGLHREEDHLQPAGQQQRGHREGAREH